MVVRSALVLRNRERKVNASRTMRPATAGVVQGHSRRLGLIQSRERCCPATVGMANGTGDLAQRTIFQMKPMMNTAPAASGKITPNRYCRPSADPAHPTQRMSRVAANAMVIPLPLDFQFQERARPAPSEARPVE